MLHKRPSQSNLPERLSPGALKRNFRHPNDETGWTAALSEIREFRIGQTVVEKRDELNDRRKIINPIAKILNYAPLLETMFLKIRFATYRDHGSSAVFLINFHSFNLDCLHDGYVVLSLSCPFVDTIEWTVF